MSEVRIQLKLVAVADIQLKTGQEIDATITVSEQRVSASEIAEHLVMMCRTLPDPSKPSGLAALSNG